RLDALPPFDKRAVLSAAVAGRNFWEGSLPGAGSPELPAALTRLIAREIIQTRRSRIAGEREFEFRHAVVQSVAYEHTLKKERAQDHRRIAEWLEAKAGNRAEFAGEIGEHWKRGEEPRRALPFVLIAADDAVRAFARLEEATVVEDAVGLSEQVRDDRGLATALRLRGRLRRIAAHPGAEEDLRRAISLAEQLDDSRTAAQAGVDLAGALYQRGAFAEVENVAKETLTDARSAGSLREETQALNMLGIVEQMRGNHGEAERRYREALDCARRDGDPALEGFVLVAIGAHLQSQGREREAVEAFESALGKTSRENETLLRSNLGASWLDLGDLGRARTNLEEAVAMAKKIGSRVLEAEATIRLGAALAAAGNAGEGSALIESGCSTAREIRATEPLAEGLLRGALLLASSDPTAARARLDEARALAERDGLADLLKKIEAGKASLG
ncbi:MAG TPA: tetratricopeptide repeat protein, partial [bacterium]|nr:tetratricopeptide repeat protein [bacterium]